MSLPIDQLTNKAHRLRTELKETQPMTKVAAHNIIRPLHMSVKGYNRRIAELIDTEIKLKSRIAYNLGAGRG